MLRISLRQVEAFVAVARTGTVTQGAAEVGITQSALSQALAEFEAHLGVQVFDRPGRRLVLNGHGRHLLPMAASLLERARELERQFASGACAVHLHLGASLTVGNYLMPGLIAEFQARHPGSRLDLMVANTRQVVEAIARFEIDIGFIEGPCFHPDIMATPWRRDALAIYAGPAHPLARQAQVTPADLRAARWIMREPGSGTREVVEHALLAEVGPVEVALELGGTEAIKRAVAAGLGLACLPVVATEAEVRAASLVPLDVPALRLERRLLILTHRQKYQTKGARQLLDLCLEPAER